jgi:polyisoprenoid-binding protein YceI
MSRLLCILLLLFSGSAMAAEAVPHYVVDTEKSHVIFTATVNGAPSKGRFQLRKGEVQFSPTALHDSHATLTIATDSLATDYAEAATTLRTPDWLDIPKFPDANFVTDRFEKVDDTHFIADGTLTLRGISQPIRLTFTLDEQTAAVARAHGRATLHRLDYQVGTGEWKDTSVVANEVALEFDVTATASPSSAAKK